MATTTPNYGWDVPTSTDYVKDGALAIETLGDDIDASVWSITGGKNVGLVHLNTTTITAAASYSINNVFSSAYDNYVIEVSNFTQTSAGAGLFARMRVGGVDNTAMQYYTKGVTNSTGVAGYGAVNTVAVLGAGQSIPTSTSIQVQNPAQALPTCFQNSMLEPAATNIYWGLTNYHYVNTAFDGISFSSSSGTITATIRIYGYRNS